MSKFSLILHLRLSNESPFQNQDNLNIAIFTNTIYPVPGGLQRYTYYLAETLANQGHQVMVYTAIGQEFGNAHQPFNCKVIAPKKGTEGLLAKFQLFFNLRKVIKEQKPHLIICTWWEPLGYLLAIQRLIFGNPFIIIGHGQEILTSNGNSLLLILKNQLRIFSFRTAAKAAGVSRYSKNLISKLGVSEDNILLLPNGLNQSYLDQALLKQPELSKSIQSLEGLVIFQPGRIEPRKGHVRILDVLKELELALQKPIYYVISGVGSNETYLKNEIIKRDLEKRVFMLGYLSETALHACYQRADIVTTLSYNEENPDDVEGFGIVYLEAYAHKKPVLAYAYGGVPDAVIDGKTGFLLKHGDRQQLINKAQLLLSDDDLRKKMGDDAHHWLRHHAWWPDIIKRLFNES